MLINPYIRALYTQEPPCSGQKNKPNSNPTPKMSITIYNTKAYIKKLAVRRSQTNPFKPNMAGGHSPTSGLAVIDKHSKRPAITGGRDYLKKPPCSLLPTAIKPCCYRGYRKSWKFTQKPAIMHRIRPFNMALRHGDFGAHGGYLTLGMWLRRCLYPRAELIWKVG
jgi:hypothetical protein